MAGPHIRQRKDGRWEARLQRDGRRLSLYGKTEKEVREKLQALERQALLHGGLAAPLTLSEALERWYATEKTRWSVRTQADYRRVLAVHVLPALGRARLTRLAPDKIQRVIDAIPSPRWRKYTFQVLHRFFSVAQRWGWCPNLCDAIVPPTYRASRKEVWTVDHLRTFLQATAEHRFGALFLFLVTTGCRLAEALGVRWADLDLEHGRVAIRRTLQRLRGQWVEGRPKTAASERILSLPPETVRVLRRLRARQAEWRLQAGTAWHDLGLVFCTETGGPLHPAQVQHAMQNLCRALGLPPCSPHGLRHLHASLLLDQGLPVPVVSARLGHATPGVTMTVYAHRLRRDDERVGQALEQVLAGGGPLA